MSRVPDDTDRRISLRVTADAYARIEKVCRREHRPVANWVKAVLMAALDQVEPAAPPPAKSTKK